MLEDQGYRVEDQGYRVEDKGFMVEKCKVEEQGHIFRSMVIWNF